MRLCAYPPTRKNSTNVLGTPQFPPPQFSPTIHPTVFWAPLFRSNRSGEELNVPLQCLNCSTQFEPVRRTQKYCCPECRKLFQKRAWRRRNHAQAKYACTGLDVGWKRCQGCQKAFMFEQPAQKYCPRCKRV